jgi:hypothetical protein
MRLSFNTFIFYRMKQAWNIIKPFIGLSIYVFGILVVVSLFDIVISVVQMRFYTDAAFITLFGVAGVFAAFLGCLFGMEIAGNKNRTTRISLSVFLILVGILFFFLISEFEGGEYRSPFKAYGITIVATSLFLMSRKFDDI